MIGATAGLFTLLVLESHAVKLADDAEPTPWAAWALFTFVAGFSSHSSLAWSGVSPWSPTTIPPFPHPNGRRLRVGRLGTQARAAVAQTIAVAVRDYLGARS